MDKGEYYKTYDKLDSMGNKYEFSKDGNKKKPFIYQDETQMLLRKFISPYTIYDRILLYQNVGSGKTCSAITMAEGFKEFLSERNRKVFVLVKNDNIENNFKNELISKCTYNEYITDTEREIISDRDPYNNIELKKEINLRIRRDIRKYYTFMGFQRFSNVVLGLKKNRNKNEIDNNNEHENDEITHLNDTVIIIDEVHNILNKDNNTYRALIRVLERSSNFKLILLSATPVYDNVVAAINLNNLLNIGDANKQMELKGYEEYLESNTIFKKTIIRISEPGLNQLKHNLIGKISYLKQNDSQFPLQIDMGKPIKNDIIGSVKIIECEMSDYQYNIYKMALRRDTGTAGTAGTTGSSSGIVIEDIDDNKSSSLYKNSSDASTMCYPEEMYGKAGFYKYIEKEKAKKNDKNDFKYTQLLSQDHLYQYSSKLYELIKNVLKTDRGNVFIYSNYVTAGGTNLLKYLLLSNGFKNGQHPDHPYKNFIVLDDSISPTKREEYRKIFNSYENREGELIRVIIGSPVMSEGITLKCIRQLHILEPFWNLSKINQIIGRGVRNQSHIFLPPSDRTIEIYKYASVKTNNEKIDFIDKEKYSVSEEKDRINKKVERIFKEISIDCEFNYENNKIPEILNGTAQCDYIECDYKCLVQNTSKPLDTDTYQIYIDFFDKYEIEYIIIQIKALFKSYYIYTFDDIKKYLIKKLDHKRLITDNSIIQALKSLILDKTSIIDVNNRNGYIIKRNQYYIFNVFGKKYNKDYFNIYDSLFNFNENVNLYTIYDVVNKFTPMRMDPDDDTMSVSSTSTAATTSSTVTELSDIDQAYNDNLFNTYKIFGAFKNDVFKIIKNAGNYTNRRDRPRGISTISIKKDELRKIAEELGIILDVKETNASMSTKIRKFLVDNNRIMK
jgi:superfamily II DNA or RNA helicase